jgi:hypothetical protein
METPCPLHRLLERADTSFLGEHTLPTTAHLGRGIAAGWTPLMTSPVASLSVNRRFPSLADRPAAPSSPPPFAGERDGVPPEPPRPPPDFAGEDIRVPRLPTGNTRHQRTYPHHRADPISPSRSVRRRRSPPSRGKP